MPLKALTAVIDVARRTGVTRLFALCHPEHRSSQRVLEKCGFVRDDPSDPAGGISESVSRRSARCTLLCSSSALDARKNHAGLTLSHREA